MDLGPINAIICWQAIVLAVVITTITHGVKNLIDYKLGGSVEREKTMWVNRLLLPSIPIILGVALATTIPLTPDLIAQYLVDKGLVGMKRLLVLGSYGVVVGQFADYVWHRVSGFITDRVKTDNGGDAGASSPMAGLPGDVAAPGAGTAPLAAPAVPAVPVVLVVPAVPAADPVPPPPSIPPVVPPSTK